MLLRVRRSEITLLVGLALAAHALGALAEEYPCMIEPYRVVNASTAAEGVLASVEVEKGQRVEQGQVVATLESAVERATLEQGRARARLAAALQAREVKLQRARGKYKRAVDLSGAKFVSPDEIEELRSAVDVAELELAAEREAREIAELDVQRVQALYDLRFIRSPVTGVVVERLLNAGEFAQAQPILTLAQIDPLNVEVVLPTAMYGKVMEGGMAEVLPEEPVGGTHRAKITIVDRVIDAASGTFSVRLELPNPDLAVPAGLECRVRFDQLP
jgi:RND family efflux transporter MFP subunit